MLKSKIICMITLTLITWLGMNSAYSQPALKYQVKDLGYIPGYSDMKILGITNQGVVLGELEKGEKWVKLFISRNGEIEMIDPPTSFSISVGWENIAFINDKNQIAYQATRENSNSEIHIMLRQPNGETEDLYPKMQDTVLFGLNNQGDILGMVSWSKRKTVNSILLYKNNFVRELHIPVENISSLGVYGLNDKDQILGTFEAHSDPHAFLWDPTGRFLDFNEIMGKTTVPVDVNNNGDVLLRIFHTDEEFIYSHDGNVEPILNPKNIYLTKMNDKKEILGRLSAMTYLYYEGKVTMLPAFIDDRGEWDILTAYAMNDIGDLAGIGRLRFEENWPKAHLIVMNPVAS